jgi:hypothetical protein
MHMCFMFAYACAACMRACAACVCSCATCVRVRKKEWRRRGGGKARGTNPLSIRDIYEEVHAALELIEFKLRSHGYKRYQHVEHRNRSSSSSSSSSKDYEVIRIIRNAGAIKAIRVEGLWGLVSLATEVRYI